MAINEEWQFHSDNLIIWVRPMRLVEQAASLQNVLMILPEVLRTFSWQNPKVADSLYWLAWISNCRCTHIKNNISSHGVELFRDILLYYDVSSQQVLEKSSNGMDRCLGTLWDSDIQLLGLYLHTSSSNDVSIVTLAGAPKKWTVKLQYVMNAATRILTQTKKCNWGWHRYSTTSCTVHFGHPDARLGTIFPSVLYNRHRWNRSRDS